MGADTIVAIRRLKVILPTVYFVFNYLINHPEGRVLMRETRAEMTLEEAELFMLWVETAIAATENEMLCSESRRVLNCLDPTILVQVAHSRSSVHDRQAMRRCEGSTTFATISLSPQLRLD